MNKDTSAKLLEINRQFYQSFAKQFSATRGKIQPGVRKIIQAIPDNANILDLGCGNGELWLSLVRSGFTGHYTGVDFSQELLDIARQKYNRFVSVMDIPKPRFLQLDLASANWQKALPENTYEIILAFATLHHLPGRKLREQTTGIIHQILNPQGSFMFSVWQFLNSERLRSRILPWERVGFSEKDVDPGDYLLDWRHGGTGMRYVHHFDHDELAELASKSGFQIIETCLYDGHTGNLGLYQIWELLT